MKWLVVTAFEPFMQESVNSSLKVLEALPEQVDGVKIFKMVVPVEFYRCISVVIEDIERLSPIAVLSLGQAGGRDAITPERIAINIADSKIPDNIGAMPVDEPINIYGEAAFFSTLPVKEMTEAIQKLGIKAALSNTAGTYVCNYLMYSILDFLYENELDIPAGFMHLPYLDEQVKDKPGIPSMSFQALYEGTMAAI